MSAQRWKRGACHACGFGPCDVVKTTHPVTQEDWSLCRLCYGGSTKAGYPSYDRAPFLLAHVVIAEVVRQLKPKRRR